MAISDVTKYRKLERDPDIINKHFPIESNPKRPNANYLMKNGVVTREDLFLYAPKDTIPAKDLDRFLEQCDNMIIMLDPRKVNKAEVEEIAKVYRESILADNVYKDLAEDEATLDPTMMASLDKILKAVEKRKENLAIRASDRSDGRDFNKEFTMIDILTKVASKVDLMEKEEKELQIQLKEEQKKLSHTEDFLGDKNNLEDEHTDKS